MKEKYPILRLKENIYNIFLTKVISKIKLSVLSGTLCNAQL
jgi:hypothetical protein